MYLAQSKKQENIIEYIIYMWQIEATIRSCSFNIYALDELIISQYTLSAEKKVAVTNWYKGLIKEMKQKGLTKEGHVSEVKEVLNELSLLHNMLLNTINDNTYQELYNLCSPNLESLKQRSKSDIISDIELCFNGIFGVLTLKVQNKEITEGTAEAVKTFTGLMNHLAVKYHEMKNGKLNLPNFAQN